MAQDRRRLSGTTSMRSVAAALLAGIALVAGAAKLGLAQQADSTPHAATAADEPAVGNPEDYEVLRKLLGVAPASPQPEPAAVAEPVAPAVVQPEAEVPKTEAAKPAPKPLAKPKPVVRRPPPRKAPPKPKAVPKPNEKEAPAAPAEDAVQEAAAEEAATEEFPMPAVGDVLSGDDALTYAHAMGPSVQWLLLRGASIKVGPRKPIAMEEARAAATQRYHAQVALSPDKKDMRNFVAGIPFPLVTSEDPDAAPKIIFNQQSRLIVDDVDARKMGCHLAAITNAGLKIERTFQIEHWRRLFYAGRLYHQPVPTWQHQDGIRYRELQYPLIEPFDLKGGGWNYTRYNDVGRPDDGWLYYPVMRRIRRISTAQRSQGFFGQDMDLDSFTGYAGNPAWMHWRLVGEKTILAPMHSDHNPVAWQAPPADFAPEEPWEPREVFVVEGRSLLTEYAFARRVIYVDKESYLVPYSEIYDNQGKLWKALHQVWGFGSKVRADAGGRTFEEFYLPGYSMIDMQIDHITRCELPLSTAVGDKGWFYNYGEAEGTTEQAFDIAGMVGESH